jgi:hypothetical protein
MRQSVDGSAGPCRPVSSHGQANTASVGVAASFVLAMSATPPESTKSHTNSDSVHAVRRALTRKSAHSSRSLPSVLFMSL